MNIRELMQGKTFKELVELINNKQNGVNAEEVAALYAVKMVKETCDSDKQAGFISLYLGLLIEDGAVFDGVLAYKIARNELLNKG